MPIDKIISEDSILNDAGFFWRGHGGVKVLTCRPLDAAGFANGFSTRSGGVSNFGTDGDRGPGTDLNLAGFKDDLAENIAENRRRFFVAFNEQYKLATVWQVHGDGIKIVRSLDDAGDSDDRSDALVSNLSGLFLGVKTADCVPLLIADPVTGAFAAIHAGWRGTLRSIAAKAVAKMGDVFGSSPSDMLCAIGPAALGCCYEIGNEVIEAFADRFTQHDKYFRRTREGHALVDLHLANEDQLVGSGLDKDKIFKAPLCTMERTDLFFSYRAENARLGKTGRLMAVIGRKALAGAPIT